MTAPSLDPERFYTPFQRREVIAKLSSAKSIDIVEAAKLFTTMEFENPDGLKSLIAKFDEAPPKTPPPSQEQSPN